MKKTNKILMVLGCAALGLGGIGVASAEKSHSQIKVAEAGTTTTKTYAYGDKPNKYGGFTFSAFTDKTTYYLLDSCTISKAGVFGTSDLNIDKTKLVVITINHATYGSGTNPSDSTFAFYNETSGTGTAITGTKSGYLATSSTYVDVIYTFAANAFTGNDFCIKVTKPGKQIRFASFTIEYTVLQKTVSSLAVTGSLAKKSYYSSEAFDPSGLTVTATFSDTTTADVTANVTWSKPTAGQDYVTGTYVSSNTVTCQSPAISVTADSVSSVAISTNPQLFYYVGDVFTLSKMVVTATYASGVTANVTSECTSDTAEGTVLSTTGSKTVVISYTFSGTTKTANLALDIAQNSLAHAGTEADPLSIRDVCYLIDKAQQGSGKTWYVKGLYTSTDTAWSASYKNISIILKDSGTDVKSLLVYRMSAIVEPSLIANTTLVSFSVTSSNIVLYNSSYEVKSVSYSDPDKTVLDTFVTNYMHTDVAYTESGTGLCTSSGWYSSAKAAFNALTARQRSLFIADSTNYANPYQRLVAWATANGEAISSTDNTLGSNIVFNRDNEDSSKVYIYIVASLAVLAAGAFFIARKKKQA